MIKRPFFIKLFLTYFGILTLFMTSAAFIGGSLIRKQTEKILARDLEKIGITLRPQVQALLSSEKIRELDEWINYQGRQADIRLTVILPDGSVPADSRKDHLAMESHWDRPEFSEAMQGRIGRAFRFSQTLNEQMLYVAVPVMEEGKVLAVVRASVSAAEIENLFADLRLRLMWSLAISLSVALFLAAWISRSQSRPVEELIAAARQVSTGNFETKVFLTGSDELRELAWAFNTMTEKVKQLFEQQTRQQEEFNLVLSSIQEGLLVVDRDQRVLMTNPSFRKMAGAFAPEGKLYWEVLRAPELLEAFGRVKAKQTSDACEISVSDKIYLCSLTPVPGKSEIVVLFFDITERKKLENIKRDLVSNISHEFRTPLTSIKGFLEAIETEEDIQHKDYLEILKRNTDRLIAITHDLLLINQLEQGRSVLQIELQDLGNIAQNTVHMFESMAAEKGLKLLIQVEPELPRINGDRYMLEQMLVNLLQNAVRYTEKGEIILQVRKQNEEVEIEVTDTGIGIPEKDLPRIFERFYVVDRSRSRRLGGTGLGLSIVKNIAVQHKGRVEVKSRIGAGSTFSVFLPVTPKPGQVEIKKIL
jgi:two-component system phosphate regulon sensor histidine kinase PhoR